MKATREWTETAGDDMPEISADAALVRVLWVADGTLGHRATLGLEESPDEALRDYAAGYDKGGHTEITVVWRLYEHGKRIDEGRFTF